MPERLRWTLVVMVTAVWATHVLAPIFVPTYESAPEVNVAFMTIVGALIALPRSKKGDE